MHAPLSPKVRKASTLFAYGIDMGCDLCSVVKKKKKSSCCNTYETVCMCMVESGQKFLKNSFFFFEKFVFLRSMQTRAAWAAWCPAGRYASHSPCSHTHSPGCLRLIAREASVQNSHQRPLICTSCASVLVLVLTTGRPAGLCL